jgi:hypothetical protein
VGAAGGRRDGNMDGQGMKRVRILKGSSGE